MCNRLHDNFEKIPPEGKAYKLARTSVSHLQGWTSLTGSRLYYASGGGWIKWTPRFSRPEEPGLLGFCFMPTLEEAHDVRALWDGGIIAPSFNTKIIEVDYRQGLGRFMESHFVSCHSVRVMLAREFKITKTVEKKFRNDAPGTFKHCQAVANTMEMVATELDLGVGCRI